MAKGTDAAEIGVFGGSGFYSLLDDVREVKVDTPYGPPSDSVFLAEVGGRRVAFLPRHGRRHTLPPHKINYRANVWAMRSLGVKAVISPCAAGSLQLPVKPGDFVVCDQFVDRTSGRIDTFYDGPIVTHLSSADVYDPVLRGLAVATIRDHGIEVHDGGTVVVIQGPRFSSKAESKWFSDAGWEVINMTQYPEAWLCRELGMAVVNIALITDYDAGVIEGTEAVDAMSVLEVFQQNAERIQGVVIDLIGRFPADLDALGARAALDPTRGDGHTIAPRGHPAVRDRAVTDSALDPADELGLGSRLPLGVGDPHDPGRTGVVAGECQAPGRRGLRRGLGVGPLHGQGRVDRAGRRVLDDPVDGRRPDGRGHGRVVRAERHEPPPGARRADGVDAPDRQRRPARPGHRDRRRTQGARGLRDGLPGGPGTRRPPRGGRRGDARAVDRRAGHPRLAVLPVARGVRPPGASAASADHRRRRDAGRGATGRADRRRLVGIRRQLRAEPAALSRVARGVGAAARGPAGHRRLPG